MKNIFAVIVGLSIGTALSLALIQSKTAASAETASVHPWNEAVAAAETIEWRDIFAPLRGDPGEDLYLGIYAKLNVAPRRNALKEVAFNYGMTTDEADEVVRGGIAPILNKSTKIKGQLGREDALIMVKDLQDDFADLLEVFSLEQEVDTMVVPNELFANGDLSDSGFDLIHDLDVIEEILFLEDTPTTVGAPFKGALTSPYNPTVKDRFYRDEFITSDTPGAVETSPYNISAAGQGLKISDDKEVKIDLLESDVCVDESLLKKSLDNFEGGNVLGATVADGEESSRRGVARSADEDDGSVDGGSEGGTKAAPAQDWRLAWCPGVTTDTEGVDLSVGLCLETELILDRVSPFQPKDSCVRCEVAKINENLDKVLSHTLVPNKITGNLFESAKCKTSDDLFNIQFVTIWNPVPTPPNDDLIYDKDIYEEWNDFVERYNLFLPYVTEDNEQYTEDFQVRFQSRAAPGDLSRDELFDDLRKVKAARTAEAELNLKAIDLGPSVQNVLQYGRNVLEETLQMNSFFKNFNDVFKKIDKEALQKIKAKPDVD